MPHVPDASSDDGPFDPSSIPCASDNEIEASDTSSETDSSEGSEVADDLEQDRATDIETDKSGESSESVTDEEFDQQIIHRGREDASSEEEGQLEDTEDEDTPNTPMTSTLRSNRTASTYCVTATPSDSPPHYTRSMHNGDHRAIYRDSSFQTPRPHPLRDVEDDRDRQIRQLQRELKYTRALQDAAETHALYAQRECAVWKYRYNRKKEKAVKGSSRRVTTSSRIMTKDDGYQDIVQEEQRRRERQEVEALKKAQKAAKQKEDLVRRATQGSTTVFEGPLSSKNKTYLEDIANALGIDMSGTKTVLITRINDYFEQHPRFKEDPRFIQLFNRSRGRKRRAPADGDENLDRSSAAEPQSQRRCLTSTAHLSTITNLHSDSPLLSYPSGPPVASSSRVRLDNSPLRVIQAPQSVNHHFANHLS